jgi:hypothetical protein
VTVTLNVLPINDAPVVSVANSQRNYTEQASSISIDSSLTISDIDSTHLTGATVTITNGDVSGMDELIFTSVFGITGVFDAATDTLTFSGTASVSSYQTILRSVRFRNMSDTPLASVRTVTVQVTDGSATAGDSRNIRVEAINDAPIITSNGGTNSASVNVSEYTTAVTTVTTSDVDGGTASYSISGGSDQTHFIINSTTGVLEFVTAQRFLTPTDADGNNTYEVQVQVSDGYGGTDTQLLQVHVRNVNEVPTSTAIPTVTVAEDSNPFVIQTASSFADPDLDTLSYQIVHVDSATSLFNSLTVNSTTGVVSVSLRANAHGTAVVTLRATDPTGLFTDEQLTINVLPVNDAPVVRNYVGSIVSSQTLTVSAPGVLQGASDVEGQTIQAVLIQGPQHGTLTLSANGRFVYRPNEGYFGFDSFRFAGTDGVATGATATATIEVTAPPTSTSSSGSSSSSSSSGSSSTTSTTSSSGSTNGASSTTTTNTSSSAGASSSATTSGTGTQSTTANTSSAPALSGTNNITEGAETTSESNSDDDDDRLMGLYTPKTAESKDTLMIKVAVSDFNSQSHVRDESRRYGSGDVFAKGPDHFYSNWDSRSELTPQELERQLIYRELAVRSEAQINDFEEKLTRNINMDGRVVGSVGVVTTGFSVGYLIWAVRGGMLLSGVLSQIPAWTMLDPLMVIDGEGKEDDKESLQTIMDRQQAKLNSNPQPSHLPAESRISDS